MKLERYNSDTYRVMNGEVIEAFVLHLSNNKWGLYNTNDKKLTSMKFEYPSAAKIYYEEVFLGK